MPGAVLDRTIWAGVVVTERSSRYPGVGMDVQSGPVEAGEQNLVDRLRAGDGAAFTGIVRGWSPAMIKVARQYVASHASAEEAVQETWLAVIKGIDRFQGRSSLRTWVFHILANIARRQGTTESRTLTTSPVDDADSGPTVDPNRFRPVGDRWAGGWRAEAAPRSWGPESATLNAEARVVLTAALAELPQRQRMVVELRDVHGLPADEVCGILALSPANQRVLLHRARAKLREQLETYYTGPNEPAVRP